MSKTEDALSKTEQTGGNSRSKGILSKGGLRSTEHVMEAANDVEKHLVELGELQHPRYCVESAAMFADEKPAGPEPAKRRIDK